MFQTIDAPAPAQNDAAASPSARRAPTLTLAGTPMPAAEPAVARLRGVPLIATWVVLAGAPWVVVWQVLAHAL